MSHVTEATVEFGPWPRYAGLRGWIRSSAPVYNALTGAPIFPNPLPFVLNPEGLATLKLPFTDLEVANPRNFTYEVRWVSGYQSAPPVRKFALPSDMHKVNYMALVQSSTVPGVYVPLEPTDPSTSTDTEPHSSTQTSPVSSVPVAYSHLQTVPAATWLITHPLSRKPTVTLIQGGRVVYTDVEYPDNDRVTVTWSSPTVGEAHLT